MPFSLIPKPVLCFRFGFRVVTFLPKLCVKYQSFYFQNCLTYMLERNRFELKKENVKLVSLDSVSLLV